MELYQPFIRGYLGGRGISDTDAADVNAFNRLLKPGGGFNRPAAESGIHDPTNDATSTLQWLLRAGSIRPSSARSDFAAAWDLAQVPVRWRIGDSPRSVTRNRIDVGRPWLRTGFRKPSESLVRHVMRPLDRIE